MEVVFGSLISTFSFKLNIIFVLQLMHDLFFQNMEINETPEILKASITFCILNLLTDCTECRKCKSMIRKCCVNKVVVRHNATFRLKVLTDKTDL